MSYNPKDLFPDQQKDNVYIPIVSFLTSIVTTITTKTAWINLLVMFTILIQVTLRYGFHAGEAWVDEFIWHLYAFFMFGLSYAITTDSHIRVDIMHMKFTRRKQRIIEVLGIVFLIMPFTIIIFDHSIGWVHHSFMANEFSENTTGLPYRWVVKSLLPISLVLIFIASLSELIKNIVLLIHGENVTDNRSSDGGSAIGRLFTPTITNHKEV
jgi:TRAP-type mannitol/chloroaromatic compound transport system permease small subunit